MRALAEDDEAAGLDDRRFLGGDLRERIAEDAGVVKADTPMVARRALTRYPASAATETPCANCSGLTTVPSTSIRSS